MTRYTLHVPETRNDGSLVEPEVFAEIEGMILDRAGGYTLTHGIGAWRGDGTTYREPVRLYAVDTDVHAALVNIAHDVARMLDQEAVYLTAQEIAPTLIYQPTAR